MLSVSLFVVAFVVDFKVVLPGYAVVIALEEFLVLVEVCFEAMIFKLEVSAADDTVVSENTAVPIAGTAKVISTLGAVEYSSV